MPYVAGVDQPRLKSVGFQQVKHRLPVVAGRFHDHPFDPQVDQMVRQFRRERDIVECVDTSCNRLFRFPSAGTRTQHTSSALPISRAAALAIISSSSWDSASMVLVISSPNPPVPA